MKANKLFMYKIIISTHFAETRFNASVKFQHNETRMHVCAVIQVEPH